MRKIEYTCMILALLTALVSVYTHWNQGWQAISWQVCTMLWIGTAWIKTAKS